MKHPDILPNPVPIYDFEHSPVPERLRVSFADGRTELYHLYVRQPAPQVEKCIRIIKHMKETTVGYQYKPRRRGRK